MPADVRQEELEAVAGADRGRGLGGDRDLLLGLPRAADVEADRLELLRDVGDLLVAQVELERERLELGRLDVAALLGALDEGASLDCL